MGRFANPGWMAAIAWIVAGVIILLNAFLLWQTVAGWLRGEG
jgi:manganese transport protein